MLDPKCNSEIPHVFAPVVVTKTLGPRKSREIRARIYRQVELWERVIHAGLGGGGGVDRGKSTRGPCQETC